MLYLCSVELLMMITVVFVLMRRGLHRCYPAFVAFLGAKATQALCLLFIDEHNPQYGMWWALTSPVLMTLQVLVVWELTKKIVMHFPKIESRGASIIIYSCFGVGAIVGGISSSIQFGSGHCVWYVPVAVGASKLVDWISVGALGFASAWFAYNPAPVARNVQWHRWLLMAYIGVGPGIALMLGTVAKNEQYLGDLANWGLEIIETLCCCCWSIMLTQENEVAPFVAPTMSDEEFSRIQHECDEVFRVLKAEFPLPELMLRKN